MSYIINTIKGSKKVFSNPNYILLAIGISLIVFIVANLLPNHEFLRYTLMSDIALFAKIKIITGLLLYFQYNGTIPSQIFFLLIAIFSGLNVALASYYIKNKIIKDRAAGIGTIGIVGGFFGIGCGACGSVVLTSLIGLSASTQITGALPLSGLEFSIVSFIILLISTLYIGDRIIIPPTCVIKPPK